MSDPAIISEPKRREERVILFEGMYSSGAVGATLKVDIDTLEETADDIVICLKQKDGSFEVITHNKRLLQWYSIRRTTIVWPDIEVKKPTRGPMMTGPMTDAATGLL